MSQETQAHSYEKNYAILEKITESLNKDEVGIDDLVEKTREALNAARTCMEILNKQKREYKKLESEFSQLLQPAAEAESPPLPSQDTVASEENIGRDDPF
jgi:exodeoxyribonuclease VII small subunit